MELGIDTGCWTLKTGSLIEAEKQGPSYAKTKVKRVKRQNYEEIVARAGSDPTGLSAELQLPNGRFH